MMATATQPNNEPNETYPGDGQSGNRDHDTIG